MGLAARLQERTATLHREAERSGFIRTMLQGRASRSGYALFLLNLLPAYRALECGLEKQRFDQRFALFARPELYRTPALERDLAALLGEVVGWPAVLPEGGNYASRIDHATGPRLLAHAYVRYLGDLSGGQILARLLARSPGIEPGALNFYDFPAISDLKGFGQDYRAAIDSAALTFDEAEEVLDEACIAFEHNIKLSEALARVTPA